MANKKMNNPNKTDLGKHMAADRHTAPVTDQHSALVNLAMRGHGTTNDQRDSMTSAAGDQMPDEARQAAMDDSTNPQDGEC